MTDPKETRAALSRLLDAYGADSTRWPASTRGRFDALLASDPDARRLVREAATLDRLLSAADAPAAISPDLVARITARAVATPPKSASVPKGAIVDMAAHRRARKSMPRGDRAEWRAAAVLAASLAFGLYIGGQGLGSDLVETAARTVGLEIAVDPAALVIADVTSSALEDDAL